MTNSFQSTAFRGSARPVDTFVAPPSVQPKTSIESLAETLAAINPNLQKFIGAKLEETVEQEKQKGAEIALEETKSELRNVVSKVRKQDGDDAARQLIGGSIFAQAGYEKQKAVLAGDSASRKIKSLYENYSVKKIKNGQEISIPISHFDVGSSEYKIFLEEAVNYDNQNLEGIRSNYLSQYFLPKQAAAIEDVTATHVKNHNEFNFQRTKKQALPTIFSNLETFIDGDKETAITNVNEYIEDNVVLGLTSDKKTKFFDSLLDIGESSITRLYNVTGKVSDINSAIEMLGEINYGPSGTSKFKNHPKFETTFLDLKDKLADQKDKDNKRELEKIKAVENQTIETILEKYPDDVERANALLDFFPFRKKKILETIEIFETDRSSKYQDLQLDVGSGLYANRPDEALEELKEIWDSHGGTATPEDKTNYDKTFSVIQNFKKAAPINYNTRINKAVKQANSLLGGKYDEYGYTFEDNTKGMQAIELENEFTRNVIDQIQNTTGLSNDEKENKFRILKDDYIAEAQRIGSGKTKEQVENEQEIQALSEYSGLSIDQIKQILSEDKMETVIEPNNMTKTNTEKTDTDNEPGGSGKSFFEIIGKKDDLPQTESRVIQELTSMGGVTKENRDKLIEQVIEEKEKMNVTNIAGKSQADSIIKFLRTGEYGFGFGGSKTYEPLKSLVDTNNLEASAFSDDDTPTTVTVEQGDTLSELADQFGSSVEAIMKANNLTNPDMIKIGQELVMPIVERINMKEVKDNQIKALNVILKDTDKTKIIPQPKIEEMLLAVGFEPNIAKIMAAVAMAESAGDPMIDTVKSGSDPQKKREFSIGLLQLNMKDDRDRLLNLFDIESEQELYDPIINVIAAKRLYDEQGLKAWGAYTDNKYKQFLTD